MASPIYKRDTDVHGEAFDDIIYVGITTNGTYRVNSRLSIWTFFTSNECHIYQFVLYCIFVCKCVHIDHECMYAWNLHISMGNYLDID